MEVQIFSINIVKFKSNSIQTEFQQTLLKFHIKVQNHQNCSKSKTLCTYFTKNFRFYLILPFKSNFIIQTIFNLIQIVLNLKKTPTAIKLIGSLHCLEVQKFKWFTYCGTFEFWDGIVDLFWAKVVLHSIVR